jgi:Ca2+-binding EF-hand superfamily protein
MNLSGYGRSTTITGGKRIGSRLTHQEEEIIKVSFEAFAIDSLVPDKEGNPKRVIDLYKLVEAFQSIDASSDIEDIKLLIADIDENGDHDIDIEEWRHIMSRKFLGEEDDSSFSHVFAMLDDNKDGHIPLVEFRKMLMQEGQAPLSEQEVDELLIFADTESDGLINYRKFLKWLSNPELYRKDMSEQKEKIAANLDDVAGIRDNIHSPTVGSGKAAQPGIKPKVQAVPHMAPAASATGKAPPSTGSVGSSPPGSMSGPPAASGKAPGGGGAPPAKMPAASPKPGGAGTMAGPPKAGQTPQAKGGPGVMSKPPGASPKSKAPPKAKGQ